MAAVFGAAQTHGGSFSANNATFSFGGSTSKHLVQQVDYSFQQQVSMIFEVGTSAAYYIGGRAQGTANMRRIVGPAGQKNFTTDYGNICNPQNIDITASSGNCGGAPGGSTLRVSLQEAVLTTIGGSVNSDQVLYNETMGFMYINLDYTAAA